MISPTVGRVVWFYPYQHPVDAQPLAAIVTCVHADYLVNLAVFDPNGVTYGQTSVYLNQADGPRDPTAQYAEWMPYQKGQAAKTEALEAKVK